MSGPLLFSKNFQYLHNVYLTHGRKQLGHPLWVTLLAGGEDPQQTLQTKLGQAAALLLPPCLLHRSGDISVTPHQHTAKHPHTHKLQTTKSKALIRCGDVGPSHVAEEAEGLV